ncbi:probable ATP-dependent RNA helicase DDX58 [Pelobates cultripes]|uniref:RNA helicase n=1 Tax=Pelobates cultripes TaxID=61616 RepID=A0AAD1S9A5_PELCU|nr:probable ATP-dependent RNA helicase DDX58 [Pelobates cultripes]
MDDVKQFLRVSRVYIEKILRPSYVTAYMMTWLKEDVIEQIKHKEQEGPTVASALFIDKLLELQDEGWYQAFLDALRASGYTGLYDALNRRDFRDIECLEEDRKHLSIIYSTVKSNIKPGELVPFFTKCFLHGEVEAIKQETRQRGDIAGAEKLIDCLLRSDKKQWPKIFTIALEEKNFTPVLEVWSQNKDSECKMETESSCEEEGEQSTFTMFQYSEEVDSQNHCLSAAPEVDYENNIVKAPKLACYFHQSTVELKLRNYQDELAQPAYQGKNTIICAPTGSGKTIVALSICDHHLKSMPAGQKGKVVFLATQVPVCEQQKDVFCKYFEGSDYSVVGFCGESSEKHPVGMVLNISDIIILTPQILVNCLKEGSVPSLSIFTLMIFDECHNTIGSHPYNVLMFHYLDMKLGSTGEKCPQIVGLTASVGTGKAKNEDEATQYVYKLCASLDIEVISTVKKNTEEMEKIVYKPEKLIRELTPRKTDSFTNVMSEIMAETEKMARDMFPQLDSLSNIQNRSFGTQKYEQWIIDTQRKCCILQMENKIEERRICHALFTYTEHLRIYNDSIMINDDVRTKDALDYLKNFLENVKNGSYNQIEQQVTKVFEAKLPILEDISSNNLNPKLDDVEFILMEAYHENPQTRTLLFVKTRALVSALKNWIEETPTLMFLKPDILIGRRKTHENIGMSLPSQKGALESFKSNSESKLLIATSVADEGIDIPACNLVILYEYVGNVTKMIQVRGRGRAKDSKCILVTCKHDEAEKERINLLHEKLMTTAVENVQNLNKQDLQNMIMKIQRREKNERDLKKNIKGPKLTDENKRLLCWKCKQFACNTDDIRVIEKSHHTVIDSTFKERYFTKPHKKPLGFSDYKKKFKIFCNNPQCKEDWGISGTYHNFQDIPLIKIDKFVVESKNGKQEYFNKWNKVNFRMKDFAPEEISESFSATTE